MTQGSEIGAKGASSERVEIAAFALLRQTRGERRKTRDDPLPLRLADDAQPHRGGDEIGGEGGDETIQRRPQGETMCGDRGGEANRIGRVRADRGGGLRQPRAGPGGERGVDKGRSLLQAFKPPLPRRRKRGGQFSDLAKLAPAAARAGVKGGGEDERVIAAGAVEQQRLEPVAQRLPIAHVA